MGANAKVALSIIGVFIGGIVAYYQAQDPKALDYAGARFWVGLLISGVAPVGSYILGLAQRAPWEGPTLPTSVIRTEKTVTDPPPAADTKPPGG